MPEKFSPLTPEEKGIGPVKADYSNRNEVASEGSHGDMRLYLLLPSVPFRRYAVHDRPVLFDRRAILLGRELVAALQQVVVKR